MQPVNDHQKLDTASRAAYRDVLDPGGSHMLKHNLLSFDATVPASWFGPATRLNSPKSVASRTLPQAAARIPCCSSGVSDSHFQRVATA